MYDNLDLFDLENRKDSFLAQARLVQTQIFFEANRDWDSSETGLAISASIQKKSEELNKIAEEIADIEDQIDEICDKENYDY